MRRALVPMLLLALAGCGAAFGSDKEPQKAAEQSPATAVSARYQSAGAPAVDSLPCFKCHDFSKWADGGRFPHGFKPHKKQGHCHVCHVGVNHVDPSIDKTVCSQCHEEPPL